MTVSSLAKTPLTILLGMNLKDEMHEDYVLMSGSIEKDFLV